MAKKTQSSKQVKSGVKGKTKGGTAPKKSVGKGASKVAPRSAVKSPAKATANAGTGKAGAGKAGAGKAVPTKAAAASVNRGSPVVGKKAARPKAPAGRATDGAKNAGLKSGKITSGKISSGKVGSSPKAAGRFAAAKDFGTPARKAQPRGRARDAGDGLPRSEAGRSGATGDRTHGVGSNVAGPGSGSGGDLDTDVIGVGDHAGLAQSGPDENVPATEEVTADSPGSAVEVEGASAQDTRAHKPRHGALPLVHGDSMDHSGDDASTVGQGVGSAAASGTEGPDDDAAAGELSADEASGADNSPSDNR